MFVFDSYFLLANSKVSARLRRVSHNFDCTDGMNEYRKMTYQIIKELPKVKCPTLLIHSKSDITSLIKNYHLIKDSISSESIDSLIVDRSPHTILDTGDDREIIFDAISSFIDKNIKH